MQAAQPETKQENEEKNKKVREKRDPLVYSFSHNESLTDLNNKIVDF